MAGPVIAVVGSLNIDRSVVVPRFPAPGETVLGSDLVVDRGGKGANQAVAAARLGGQVRMVGAVGADADGDELRRALVVEGIDPTWLQTAGEPTGTAFITLHDGENSIVVASGANARLEAPPSEALAGTDAVLAQLEVPETTVEAALRMPGGRFILNPAPAPDEPVSWMAEVDVVVPNLGELGRLAGADPKSDEEVVAAARSLGSPLVIVTLGGRGAMAVTESSHRLVAAPLVEVVDTTAAGDSFCGAFAVAVAGGAGIEDAVRFAVRCAAITVGRRGAQSSLPYKKEVV